MKQFYKQLLNSNLRYLYLFSIVFLFQNPLFGGTPLSGTKYIGTTSPSPDYISISAAIADLNTNGVGRGGVTFKIQAGYTETLSAALIINASGSSLSNPIQFEKYGSGTNPLLTAYTGSSATLDGMFIIAGTDYITIDGLDLIDNNSSGNAMMEWGYALLKASASDGTQYTTIKNCTITLNKNNTNSVGIYSNNHTKASTTQLSVTTSTGTNSNNTFYGNTISNCYFGITLNYSGASMTIYDINNQIGTSTLGNNISNIGGNTTLTAGIYANLQNGLTVANDTISNILSKGASTSAAAFGIYVNIPSPYNVDIYNNTIKNCSLQSASFVGISSAQTVNNISNIYGNIIKNISSTYTGSCNIYGIDGGNPTTLNLYSNEISNNTINITSTGSFYGLYHQGASYVNCYSNNIYNNTINSSAFYGAINIAGYNTNGSPNTENIYNNIIHDLTINESSFGYRGLISGLNSKASSVKNIYGNNVYNLSYKGSSNQTGFTNVYGINLSTGSSSTKVYRNKIYGIYNESTDAGGTIISIGLQIASGIQVFVYNNLIADINASNQNYDNVLAGINIASGANTVNLYYNTIYLGATSTVITSNNFGSSGIYTNTTTSLTMINNIIANNSTAYGSGKTVAFRRGSTNINTYSTKSNNNLFYAGSTSIANNFIFDDGVKHDSLLSSFKNRMLLRDNNSISEDLSTKFISTSGGSSDFLKIGSSPTGIENGAMPISGYIDDYYTNGSRNSYPKSAQLNGGGTAPDIGAIEGDFGISDLIGPIITYTPLNNTANTNARIFTASIFDPSGMSSGTNTPYVYYRKGTSGSFVAAASTGNTGNTYSFTIDYSLVGGISIGDQIQYFVVAQDNLGNLSSNPYGATGSTSSLSGVVSNPNSYNILAALNGNYYVGTSAHTPAATFTDIPSAINAYNSKGLTGPVKFILIDPTYTISSTVVINANPDASATNTLTITTENSLNPIISGGPTNALIEINGASYITIDGSNTNGGTSRNITFNHTKASGVANNIWIASAGNNAGVNNINIKNCIFKTGLVTNTSSYGIYIGGNASISTSTGGADNQNITIQNNSFRNMAYGIYALGINTNPISNLNILKNGIGYSASAYINLNGIYLSQANNSLISLDTISYVSNASSAPIGINIGTGFINSAINSNFINAITFSGTSGQGATGIYISGDANANTNIYNNMIADVSADGNGGNFQSWNPHGVVIASGSNYGIYFNSISLNGTRANNSKTGIISSALFLGASCSNLDVRNNIFYNIMGSNNTTTPGANYAIYVNGSTSPFSIINYNNYYVTSSNINVSKSLVSFGGAALTNLSAIQTSLGQNLSSLNTNPSFTSANDLHITSCAMKHAGTNISSISNDYDGDSRSSLPDIGSDENTKLNGVWVGGLSSNWNLPANWCGNVVPSSTDDVIIPNGATFYPIIASSTTPVAQNITIANAASITINSGNLSVYGTITNNGTFTHSGGSITFVSNNIQSIPVLNYNNVITKGSNKTLGGNLSINGNLTLTGDSINLGSNTLTIKGEISSLNKGAFIGGSLSKLVIDGIGNKDTLPLVKNGLNTLTILRNTGIILNADLSIFNVLNLSNGPLEIGSSNLSINGSISGTSSMVGGNLSKLTIGGSSSMLVLPNIINGLKVFQLKRNNGAQLTTDLSVIDTVILETGLLDINGKNLILGNGSTIVRTNGSINAAPSISTGLINVLYNGNSAITSFELPTTVANLSIASATQIITLSKNINVNDNLSILNGTLSIDVYQLNLSGNFNNLGTLLGGPNASLKISDVSGSASSISLPTITLKNFILERSNGITTQGNIYIKNSAKLLLGKLNCARVGIYDTLNLGSMGTLQENDSSYVLGRVLANSVLNSGSHSNFGNIGADITINGSGNPGLTEVVRSTGSASNYTSIQLKQGSVTKNAIQRMYKISPTANGNLDATLTLNYLQNELNGLPENSLNIFRKPEAGNIFQWKGKDNYNLSLHNITLGHNIDSFSEWTIGGDLTALPVSLLYFNAEYKDGNVHLQWSTSSEINNDYFEIERSTDAKNFTPLVQINGHGNSSQLNNYSYTDVIQGLNEAQTIYYRLKQVDYNGKFQISEIKKVNLYNSEKQMKVWYDHNSDKIKVEITPKSTEPITISLSDGLGRIISTEQLKGNHKQSLQISMQGLPKGIYHIFINSQMENVQKKVLKY